ncbi:MAG: hypothetical protein RIG62_31605 [Cyclobacteriaceae bacterium]
MKLAALKQQAFPVAGEVLESIYTFWICKYFIHLSALARKFSGRALALCGEALNFLEFFFGSVSFVSSHYGY